METVYSALAVAVIVVNLLATAAGVRDRSAERASTIFWYLLRAAQLTTAAFVVSAGLIYLAGHRATDSLHYLYVLLPVVASFMAELIRGAATSQELGEQLDPDPEGDPLTPAELSARFARLDPDEQQRIGLAIVRRETLVMTIACLVTAFLVWRALETTAGLF